MTSASDPKREMLRHTVATIAYRGSKAISDAPASFAEFRAGETAGTPRCNYYDLLDRRIHQAAVEHGRIVASPAPFRRLGADRVSCMYSIDLRYH